MAAARLSQNIRSVLVFLGCVYLLWADEGSLFLAYAACILPVLYVLVRLTNWHVELPNYCVAGLGLLYVVLQQLANSLFEHEFFWYVRLVCLAALFAASVRPRSEAAKLDGLIARLRMLCLMALAFVLGWTFACFKDSLKLYDDTAALAAIYGVLAALVLGLYIVYRRAELLSLQCQALIFMAVCWADASFSSSAGQSLLLYISNEQIYLCCLVAIAALAAVEFSFERRARLDLEQYDLELGLSTLSERERQVFDAFAEGLTVREIADKNRLSSGTIAVYCRRLYEKLKADGKQGLLSMIEDWKRSHKQARFSLVSKHESHLKAVAALYLYSASLNLLPWTGFEKYAIGNVQLQPYFCAALLAASVISIFVLSLIKTKSHYLLLIRIVGLSLPLSQLALLQPLHLPVIFTLVLQILSISCIFILLYALRDSLLNLKTLISYLVINIFQLILGRLNVALISYVCLLCAGSILITTLQLQEQFLPEIKTIRLKRHAQLKDLFELITCGLSILFGLSLILSATGQTRIFLSLLCLGVSLASCVLLAIKQKRQLQGLTALAIMIAAIAILSFIYLRRYALADLIAPSFALVLLLIALAVKELRPQAFRAEIRRLRQFDLLLCLALLLPALLWPYMTRNFFSSLAIFISALAAYLRDLLDKANNTQTLTLDETIKQFDLSPLEVDLLRGICAAKSNSQLASELHYSIHSIKKYKKDLLNKLGELYLLI